MKIPTLRVPLHKFLYSFPIEAVEGLVIVEVEAESEEAGALLAKAGHGAFKFDRITVTKVGEPKCLGMGAGLKVGNS